MSTVHRVQLNITNTDGQGQSTHRQEGKLANPAHSATDYKCGIAGPDDLWQGLRRRMVTYRVHCAATSALLNVLTLELDFRGSC
jgi:hypothetical protein